MIFGAKKGQSGAGSNPQVHRCQVIKMKPYTVTSCFFIDRPPLKVTYNLQVRILVAIHLTLRTLLIILTLIHQARIIVRTAVTSSKIASALLTRLPTPHQAQELAPELAPDLLYWQVKAPWLLSM